MRIIAYDLKKPDAAGFVYREVKKMGVAVQVLINNAGFNECGSFLETNAQKELDMMWLHMVFVTQMMKLFLPSMVENTLLFKWFVMSPDKVAEIGYKAMMKGKPRVIVGLYNKLLVFSSCILPKQFVDFLGKKMLLC